MNRRKKFIKSHIQAINAPKFNVPVNILFGSVTNLKNYLQHNFLCRLASPNGEKFAQNLLNEFYATNYTKNKITNIANKYYIYHTDLKKFYDQRLFLIIKDSLHTNNDTFKDKLIENILIAFEGHLCQPAVNNSTTLDKNGFKYIKTDLKKLTEKVIDLLGFGGFAMNLQNINAGIMTANAGDSAQFLFISRAILAGYNCSNVDVRSSRYDAVIDYDGTLLRIQVKGISDSTISFVDRDRGGQGIDHKHQRNRGKRITAKDCDLYVAVDKEVGICYLIPIAEMDDKYPDEKQAKNISVKELQEYKENWAQIEKVAKQK